MSASDDGYLLVHPRTAPHADAAVLTVGEFVRLDTTTKRPTDERFKFRRKLTAWIMFCHSPTSEQIGGWGTDQVAAVARAPRHARRPRAAPARTLLGIANIAVAIAVDMLSSRLQQTGADHQRQPVTH